MITFCAALLRQEAAVSISPGRRHWRIFEEFVGGSGIRGGDTTDAYFAALAIEHGCEWWTADGDFERFDGLRYRNVLQE